MTTIPRIREYQTRLIDDWIAESNTYTHRWASVITVDLKEIATARPYEFRDAKAVKVTFRGQGGDETTLNADYVELRDAWRAIVGE